MLSCPQCHSSNMRRHSHTSAGKQRFSCKDCGHRTVSPLGIEQFDPKIDHKAVSQKIKSTKKTKRWVVTAAQNATPVHKGFLSSLRLYCSIMSAELIVIPFRYRNPTSVFTDKDYDWWAAEVTPDLVDKRLQLCEGVVVLADVQVQPTAKSPLSGMEGFTGTDSCILGHTKYQFKTVATRQGDLAKIMTTTGAVTLPNYTKSRAGKTGHHHHQLAATIVEADDDIGGFHIRQITANTDGSFTDLNMKFSADDFDQAPPAASLVLGDLHQWWMSDSVDEATFGPDGMIDVLRPENVFLHDVVDGYSVSHHHRNDPFIKYAKQNSKYGNVLEELEDFAGFIKKRKTDHEYSDFHIVSSNHDDHITRYIKETDWRSDPENAEFYLETALHMIQNTKIGEGGAVSPRPFDWWMDRLLDGEVDVIGRDSSYEILGVEHAYHGDLGPNGARGSTKNLSTVGVKVTSGHCHSPQVIDGCYSVGVSTGKMQYARGPSGWMNTHCVLYADGKRTLLHVIKGKWCS